MTGQREQGEGADVMEKWDALLFTVRTSIRYHQRRRMFFDRWNNVTSAMVLASGSSAVINLMTSMMDQAAAIVVFGGMVTFFSLLDLVVGTARMARTHEILFRRYIDLEREMCRITAPGLADLTRLEDLKLQIDADEPPYLMTLVELCYNDMSRAMGRTERVVGIRGWQKHLANFWSFEDPSHHVESIPRPSET